MDVRLRLWDMTTYEGSVTRRGASDLRRTFTP